MAGSLDRDSLMLAETEAAARADIFRQVIQNAEWWKGMDVMTDADYDAMMAEIEDEMPLQGQA